MQSNLYRRPSGIYAVRIVIPKRLRPLVGRSEIHASTGLHDPSAAKLVGLELQLAWRKRLMELDRVKVATGNPILLTAGVVGLEEAAAMVGMPIASLITELLNDRCPLIAHLGDVPGWGVPNLSNIDRDYDKTYILNDVERKGERRTVSGWALVHDSQQALSSFLAHGHAKASLFLMRRESAFFPDDEITLSPAQSFALKTDVERIRLRLARLLEPSHPPSAVIAPAALALSSAPAPANIFDPIVAKHGEKRFSNLFEQMCRDKKWSDDHKRRMATEASIFIELMSDPKINDIERDDILRYAEEFATLPHDIYKARRNFKVNTVRELIEIAIQKDLPRKSPAAIKRHIGKISEILGYGLRMNMLHFNPAADYQGSYDRLASLKRRSQDARDVFTDEELSRIFSMSWFSKGAGEFTSRGKTDWRPYQYWLPLIGLLTGARINEGSQLYLDDIVQSSSDSNLWHFDFNLNQPDKLDIDNDDEDKSLKTINSIRVVPMHPILVRLGLPEYVTALRAAGHTRLFPELKKDKIKGYGKPSGSWFNERFLGKKLGIERNGKKVFHSLRHNFETALERLDAPESVRAQLAGHVRGKTESGTRYTKDRNAIELFPYISKLNHPCLTSVAKFQPGPALAAIEVALRLKRIMKKRSARGV